MVNVILPDCIIHDIVARLPTKVLYRCRCVSKHWNSLTRDPYFIKMRSRRMILLPSSPMQVLDHNYPDDDMANMMFKLRSPYKNPQDYVVIFLGTVNGIVLLGVIKRNHCYIDAYACMILYNPFTRASKLVPGVRPCDSLFRVSNHIYGFGHGATVDDLKIVIINDRRAHYENHDTFHVFNFRTNSWSGSRNCNIEDVRINHNDVGTFLNGYLHWIVCKEYQLMIMALNLDNMVLSYIPIRGSGHDMNSRLATLHGCLCIIDNDYEYQNLFVSVMKEGVWSKQCVFIGLEVSRFTLLNILEDGRIILMMNHSNKLVIYDTLKHSYVFLELSQELDYSRCLCGIEYVETLASPSDLFAV